MSTQLNEKIEELSLMAVMLHPGDAQSFDLILLLLDDIVALAQNFPHGDRLIAACTALKELANGGDGEGFVQQTNTFVSSAQAFVKDPEGSQFSIGKGAEEGSSWGEDLSEQADKELIVEFIEKHTSLLDELEGHALEIANGLASDSITPEVLEEFQRFAKAYLHNIKGDAGSVGLFGIERGTHAVEDLLPGIPPQALIDILLSYREWVLESIAAYTEHRAPKELSATFILRIGTRQSGSSSPSSPEVPHEKEGDLPTSSTPAKTSPDLEPYQISGDLEILQEFMVEADDHLSVAEELLLTKENNYDKDDLDAIFRAVHSVKGGSSYFGLKEITRTSHSVESLMDQARSGAITFNALLKSTVLQYISIQRTLLAKCTQAVEGDGTITPSAEVHGFILHVEDLCKSSELMTDLIEGEDRASLMADDFVPSTRAASPIVQEEDSKEDSVSESQKERSQRSSSPSVPVPQKGSSGKSEKVDLRSFVKIDTERLDLLVEFIGEMVISSSMLIKNCRDLLAEEESVINNTNQLERITREIQEIGMSMRLIPIKGLFQKMSRVVWDTAKKLKKDIRFEMDGEDTELDRSVIDRLADPLMHMVRNAVDHGIEKSSERSSTSKPAQGKVRLSAYHGSGNIYIEISDDGKGLDADKLIKRARERGVIGPEDSLTEEEAHMLIFAPGFSTAEQVTDVSGRGVGMDVVRKNIESMRGRISIASEVGKGSTFTIELPLTLAIMEGIEVAIGDANFIIPTLSVVEFLRPSPDMIMKTLDRGETLKFRGMFLPIFRLSRLYGIPNGIQEATDAILVIVECKSKLVALMVDSVLGKLSAVIKSLGALFRDVEGVSGCAILPDGSVGLILDIPTLLDLTRHADQGQISELPLLHEVKGPIDQNLPM